MGGESVPVMKRFLLCLLLFVVHTAHAEDVEAQKSNPEVLIKTNLGDIVVELYGSEAPITVANFLALVESDAYKDTIFHRVIAGFMVQAGGHYLDLSEAP